MSSDAVSETGYTMRDNSLAWLPVAFLDITNPAASITTG